ALLLAGLQAALPAALSVALEDRLHQPHRLKLFSWVPEGVAAARAAGAPGWVLSWAGPSPLGGPGRGGGAVGGAPVGRRGRRGEGRRAGPGRGAGPSLHPRRRRTRRVEHDLVGRRTIRGARLAP